MSKRKMLSITDTILLLKEVENGVQQKVIAEKFGILSNSISTIIKNWYTGLKNTEILESWKKRLKTLKYDNVDEADLKWNSRIM